MLPFSLFTNLTQLENSMGVRYFYGIAFIFA